MPNYVANRIILTGPLAAEVADAIRNQGGNPTVEKGRPEAVDFNRVIREPADIGDDWYRWRCKHWGTKWNAFNSEIEEQGENLEIRFYTAWSMPQPVVTHLAKICKEKGVMMSGCFADEGIAENSGYFDEQHVGGFRYGDDYGDFNECLKKAWRNEGLKWEEWL